MSGHLRITILTYGSRGDVEPFIALGVGLRSAGHSVRLAAPASFGPFIESHELAFEPIAGSPGELTKALADRAGLSWPLMIARMVEHVVPLAEDVFRGVERAAEGADLIVHSFLMTDAGHTLARSMGVPDLSAQFFPVFLPTTAFPAAGMPDLPLGPSYRRATHLLATAVFRYGSRLLYRGVQALASDLPDLAPWPFRGKNADATPILFAYSPHILPKPPDWPSSAQVTGYWRLPLPVDWRPPRALRQFLKAGPAPVYFGPGSVRSEHVSELMRGVVAACRALKQRIVLGVRPETLDGELEGADIFYADGIPHRWLFPRMRFILHHGGAGTTAAAARAGVPSTAIPFSVDQTLWARRIYELGLGPAGPPARRVGQSCLKDIVEDALTTPTYGRRADEVREKLSGENGVTSAIEVLESLCATG